MRPGHGLLFSCLLIIAACRKSLSASLYGLEYNPEDFVVAQPTCVHRLPLTRVSREWRGPGIRSFTVLNDTKLADELNRNRESRKYLETYGYWEDDSVDRGTWRGGNVGDTRAAVTPFLAHQHFGDSYKWMLYGDDDTIFYMTGVLKLLSQFDPELPLAITDNIWYLTVHPSTMAPRCLPCGFNLSTITTNHSFTPRPACPFCTRALACGTYSSRYRCNATHLEALQRRFGPRVFAGGSTPAGPGTPQAGGSDPGGSPRDRNRDRDSTQGVDFASAMRQTARDYTAWMNRHVELKSKYPWIFRNKPAMDWEMRDPAEMPQDHPEAADGDDHDFSSGSAGEAHPRLRRLQQQQRRRRRQRRRLQRLQQDLQELGHREAREWGGRRTGMQEVQELEQEQGRIVTGWRRGVGNRRGTSSGTGGSGGGSSRGGNGNGSGGGGGVMDARSINGAQDYGCDGCSDGMDFDEYDDMHAQDADVDADVDVDVDSGGVAVGGDDDDDDNGDETPVPRRSLEGRYRPKLQGYVDGSPWLSAALGHQVARGDPELEPLQLPFPFCAKHDERLHTRAAPSCLVSISGHGGVGIIFSVGLMRLIDPQEAIRFITHQTGCAGGDCLLGRLLWFRLGIGFTDPGTALQYGTERYERFARFVDSNAQMPQLFILADPATVLLNRRRGTAREPNCDRSCVWLIENVVGTHVRAQGREVNSTVVEMQRRLRNHARAYEWVLAARRDPLVLSGNLTVARSVRAAQGIPYVRRIRSPPPSPPSV